MAAPERLRVGLILTGLLLVVAGLGFLVLAGEQMLFDGSLFAPRYSPERRETRLGLLFLVFGAGGAGMGALTIAGVRKQFVFDKDGKLRDVLSSVKSD